MFVLNETKHIHILLDVICCMLIKDICQAMADDPFSQFRCNTSQHWMTDCKGTYVNSVVERGTEPWKISCPWRGVSQRNIIFLCAKCCIIIGITQQCYWKGLTLSFQITESKDLPFQFVYTFLLQVLASVYLLPIMQIGNWKWLWDLRYEISSAHTFCKYMG